MATYSRSEILELLGGTPDEVGNDLAAFSAAAEVLSSDHPRLIDSHPMKWVGVFNGSVAASAPDFNGLMTQLAEQGIAPSQTVVRFIDRNQRTFIL